jgi:hypothetical protein
MLVYSVSHAEKPSDEPVPPRKNFSSFFLFDVGIIA